MVQLCLKGPKVFRFLLSPGTEERLFEYFACLALLSFPRETGIPGLRANSCMPSNFPEVLQSGKVRHYLVDYLHVMLRVGRTGRRARQTHLLVSDGS